MKSLNIEIPFVFFLRNCLANSSAVSNSCFLLSKAVLCVFLQSSKTFLAASNKIFASLIDFSLSFFEESKAILSFLALSLHFLTSESNSD